MRTSKPFAEDADVQGGTIVDLCVSKGQRVVAPVRIQKGHIFGILKESVDIHHAMQNPDNLNTAANRHIKNQVLTDWKTL